MSSDTLCKTVRQYNKEPVSFEDMHRLEEIAEDYQSVKNYVYQRYGGVGSLPKLYPGYTVQNEMTASGLRERLGMPSVYFYLAVYEALADIKGQWSKVKSRIQTAIIQNGNFTPEEGHYLRFVMKVGGCMEAILNRDTVCLPKELQQKYESVKEHVEAQKLDNYLRRKVRRYLVRLHTDGADGFAISERAYRYADHGIYISTKQKRQRIFVPLTDGNRYGRQLYIKLCRERKGIEIIVPVDVHIRSHKDYLNETGLSMGMFTMFTTDEGHEFGAKLGEYMIEQAEWVQKQTSGYRKNKKDNPGRKKYQEKKRKLDAEIHTYINAELNRLIQEEKPKIIYLPRLPATGRAGKVKKYNRTVSMWQRGYIRRRLALKCREHSIDFVEVIGKDISNECSGCGGTGSKEDGMFVCVKCGLRIPEKMNAAKNAKKRGKEKEQTIQILT